MASPVKIAGTFSAEMYGIDAILIRLARRGDVRRDRVHRHAGQ